MKQNRVLLLAALGCLLPFMSLKAQIRNRLPQALQTSVAVENTMNPFIRPGQTPPSGESALPADLPCERLMQKAAREAALQAQPAQGAVQKRSIRMLDAMPEGYIPQRALSPKANPTQATVSLYVAERYYASYSLGAQLLLDNSRQAATHIGPGFELDDEAYNLFPYSIPQNASFDGTPGTYVPVGNQQTLSVPEGYYTALLVDVSDEGFGASSLFMLDSLPFKAGHEYVFAVYWGDIFLYERAGLDMALTAVTSHGISEIRLTDAETITVEGINGGTSPVAGFRMGCVADGGAKITEQVDMNLQAGEYFTYTFEHKFDLSATGEHTFVFTVELEDDEFPSNDTLRTSIWNVEPLPLPYRCAFDREDDITLHWIVDDANQDGNSWFMSPYDDEDHWAAFIQTAKIDPRSPEALTMFRPVHLDTGSYNISFMLRTAYWYPEDFDLLYGTSSRTVNLQVLRQFKDILTDNEFLIFHANFRIEQADDYFFAVSARHGEDPFRIFLKDFALDTGLFQGVPDLVLEAVSTPLSSCTLSEDEELKLQVGNWGYIETEKVRFTGKITRPDHTVTNIDTVLTLRLDVREKNREVSLGYYDFSAEGDYTLDIEISTEDDEIVLDNNRLQKTVSHWTPLEIPFVSDFSGERPGDAYWTYASGWSPSPNGDNLVCDDTVPAFSRCLRLQGGTTYRYTMTFACGLYYYVSFLDDFVILYGLSGTDISGWDTLSYVQNGYTGNAFITRSLDFTPAQDGNYTLAIKCVTPDGAWGTFIISRIKIHEVADYDVDLYFLGDLPAQVPAEHINNRFSLPVQVINKGKKGITKAKVEIKMGETTVGEGYSGILNPGDEADFEVELEVSGLNIGDTAVFTATASVPEHEDEDRTPEMNSLSIKTRVSDDVLAYDFVTDSMCRDRNHYIGSMVPMHFAMPLYVMADDTLTGVSVCWGEGDAYETLISVIRYNNGLEDIIYYNRYRKSGRAGEQTFEMPALLLQRGIYVVTVQVKAMDLVSDHDPYGAYYYVDGGLWSVPGYGWPGIRGRFAHNAHPMARDAAVYGIQRPDHDAPFAENQPVVFEAGNNGYQSVNATFTLTVDGVKADEKTLQLAPYEQGTASLTGNLSALGSHEIAVSCRTEGDENPDNDRAALTVNTVAPIDPYTLDFEHCQDFAIFDFNPDWISLDMDGAYSPGYADIPDFPHMFEPFAFMAFNGGALGLTNPAMPVAYEGERFGACFYSSAGQNNDWLISPLLTLPAQDASLKFTARSEQDRKQETVNILISSTSQDPEEFFPVAENVQIPADWTEFEYDLTRFAGKSVYLALQCVSKNMGTLMVDNIRVSKPAANENIPLASRLRLYPNPAHSVITLTGTGINLLQVRILDISGREIHTSRPIKDNLFRFNVQGLVPGLYLALVQTAQGTCVMKFTVE